MTTELERQRTEELTELAQSISYGDIHDGVSKTVHRIASVSEELKEEYQSIAGDLLHISSSCKSQFSSRCRTAVGAASRRAC